MSSHRHSSLSTALCLTGLLSGTALAQCPPTVTSDDFDTGLNKQGWSFNVTVPETIETKGGNPRGWLHNAGIESFAPILTNHSESPGAILGDFRALGVTKISFDAQTLGRGFGQPTGFAMSLMLRDTKGTGKVEDDDYAYFVGPEVPQIGAGWKSYAFDIPSGSTSPLPPGWTGGSWLNPSQFRPGIDWNDVITSVDVVEFWWIDPSFFAIVVNWDVGVDNIAFEQARLARATARNGHGTNPETLVVGTLPALGTSWRTDLDCAAHTGGSAALLFASGPIDGFALPFGELLVNPAGAITVVKPPASGVPTSFAFSVPTNTALCGARLSVQGVCTGVPSLQLSNALDFVFGS